MPQGRIVLKSICQSRKLAELKSDGARLLYTWLLVSVDINGCFSGDPEVIKGQIFTRLKKSTKTILSYIEDLDFVGLIVWYKADGDAFLHIPDFVDRQPSLNPDREAKSTIPLPTPEQLQSKSGLTPLKVKESKVKERASKYSIYFLKFWDKYPSRWIAASSKWVKIGKHLASEQWNKLSQSEQQYIFQVVGKMRAGKSVPDAWRWLRDRKWEDYELPKPKHEPLKGVPVPQMKEVPTNKMDVAQKQIKDLGVKP